MTPFGPRVLSPIAAREAIDNIRKHWGEEAEPESDEQFLSVVAAIDEASGPAPRISAPRRGQYAEALSWVGRHGLPIGESPTRFLGGSGVYLNVSQFPLGVDSFFRWLEQSSERRRRFFRSRSPPDRDAGIFPACGAAMASSETQDARAVRPGRGRIDVDHATVPHPSDDGDGTSGHAGPRRSASR